MFARLTVFAVTTLLVFAAAPAPAADEKFDAKAELAKWQGTWEVELQLTDGKEQPAKERNIVKVVVKDDVWEVHFKGRDEPVKGKITLVLDGKLKGIDVAVGKNVVRAAYLMDGDRIVLAVGDIDGARPKDFTTSTGTGSGGILIYKRAKK
jgi:uncharacterized protein (TIGR03067 family)